MAASNEVAKYVGLSSQGAFVPISVTQLTGMLFSSWASWADDWRRRLGMLPCKQKSAPRGTSQWATHWPNLMGRWRCRHQARQPGSASDVNVVDWFLTTTAAHQVWTACFLACQSGAWNSLPEHIRAEHDTRVLGNYW